MWGVLWDKLLFANVRADVGRNWKEQIKSEMPCAWKTHLSDVDEFRFCRVRLGCKLGNDCFRVLGDKVPDFVKRTAGAADAGNPPVRLFAIQGAALVMRSCGRPLAHLPDFTCVSEANIRELENIFGWRWGRTTVMHALTDAGLSVKPDANLARTVRTIDLVSGLRKRELPALKQAVEINR